MNSDLEERIRARAYHIWENNPASSNSAEEHWVDARRQIEAESDVVASGGLGTSSDQSAERERGGRIAPEEQLQDLSLSDSDVSARKKA
jgi:Protein of unknown function (DUF2934)